MDPGGRRGRTARAGNYKTQRWSLGCVFVCWSTAETQPIPEGPGRVQQVGDVIYTSVQHVVSHKTHTHTYLGSSSPAGKGT